MIRLPAAPHGASVRGRARADAGPLLLSAVVVLLVGLLAGAVPGLLAQTADAAVRDAVRRAGTSADVTVTARWEADDVRGGRARAPRLADDVDALRGRALDALGPGLRAMLRPPVASVISPTLKVTDGSVLRTFRMAYLSDGAAPRVTWVDGAAPAPSTTDDTAEVRYQGPPWPVQVGLSEATATTFGVRPGARLALSDDRGNDKNVLVSGIFRPVDPAEPLWRSAPWLLNPAAGVDGAGSTRFGGLLSAGSLPDARLAFPPDELRRTVSFSPDPAVLTWESARQIAGTAVTLKARSASSGSLDTSMAWQTQLDTVLHRVGEQVDAATVQASVLLTAVLTAAVLVLSLAAGLLARRRAPALILARQRGAALTALGAELLLESTVVALTAAAAGALGAFVLTGGVAWWWAAPVVVAAVVAGPAYGIVTADAATRDRRVPANRSARRWARHTGALRRAAAELAVLVAAAAAVVALHQRGLGPGLPVGAPTLAVIAGAILVLRLLPPVTGLVLRWAVRSPRPLAMFAAAQAVATSGRALPVAALVTSAALASFALITGATVDRGLADGARDTVGADVRIDVAEDTTATADPTGGSTPTADPAGGGTATTGAAATAETARQIAARPGVTRVVTGRVTDTARVIADGRVAPVRLVIVDSRAFAELSGGPSLDGRQALVRSASGALRTGTALELPRTGAPAVRLTAVGEAPPVGGATDVVIVDAAAGVPGVPNTIWVAGPGAEQATAGLDTVSRARVAQEMRAAPLVSGLIRLTWATAVFLVVAGLLGFVLTAAAGAPERWLTLSRLRTLGLTPRDARLVAAGELLPVAAAAAVGGPAIGVLVASLTAGPLGLAVLTGQVEDPALVLPWAALTMLAAVFLAAVAALVAAESAIRRRRRLAEILRVGGP